MAESRESRLRHGLEILARLGIPTEGASVDALAGALESDAEAGLAIADLLGAIGTAESAALLARIEESARHDKLLRREARRSLYRLKQRGVAVPQAAPEPSPAARAVLGGPEAEGFLSVSDSRGDRLFWIVKPRSSGGVFHFSTVVNEPAGLKEAVLAEASRKNLRALQSELQARHGLRMVEVDWRYVDAIASEGYERARATGHVHDSVAHYAQLRLQIFPFAAKPAEGRLHPVSGDTAADLAASASLLDEPELGHWSLLETDLAPYLARYREMRDSPIVLDRSQQMVRLDDIVQSALAETFAGERAASWERRLDEAAYFLAKTGRREAAGRAGAAATAVAERKSGKGIALFEELVRRSFGMFFEQEAQREQEEKAGSVLVTPDDIRAAQARARQRQRPG